MEGKGATSPHMIRITGRQGFLRTVLTSCVAALALAAFAEPSRVRVRLDVEGELVAPVGRGVEPIRQPIAVAGRFEFIESPTADRAGAAVIREYHDAAAEIVVAGEPTAVILGDDAQQILVARVGTTAIPYLQTGFLTREERDLLDLPFDALLIDALQPTGVVAAGDTWDIPADVTAGLLAVDTIETGTMTAKLEEVRDCVARVTFSGVIDGAIDGLPTHVVVDGACRADAAPDVSSNATSLRYRLTGRVSHVTATLREQRQAGHVAPGFAVEARVAVSRTAAPPTYDPDSSNASAARVLMVGRPDRLWYQDPSGHFDLVHDARWRAVEQGAGTLILRLVDRGALVAQCSITALPAVGSADRPTIEEVQRDISRSLEGQFERFEEAAATTREDGIVVIRAVSVGTVGQLPFHWVHAVLSDDAGQRTSVAFMMESSLVERFGTADLDLLTGLRLTGGLAATTREARLPRKTATP